MSKSAPALPCSKSHIRGAVLRYEIAEIRSRLMGTVFDSNKQMCAVTLTHLHAVCRVRDHGGGGVGGRFSGRENERRTHARMACALVDARVWVQRARDGWWSIWEVRQLYSGPHLRNWKLRASWPARHSRWLRENRWNWRGKKWRELLRRVWKLSRSMIPAT